MNALGREVSGLVEVEEDFEGALGVTAGAEVDVEVEVEGNQDVSGGRDLGKGGFEVRVEVGLEDDEVDLEVVGESKFVRNRVDRGANPVMIGLLSDSLSKQLLTCRVRF